MRSALASCRSPRRLSPLPRFAFGLSLTGSLAAGCGGATPPPDDAPSTPPAPPAAVEVGPVATTPPAAPTSGPGDQLPEPTAPDQECVWRPHVRCLRASSSPPPAAAPPPYDGCATEVPALPENSSREVRVARLSPRSTRAARKADPQACCYVEFVLQSCR
jgi:hypothetical protein